MYTQHNVPLQLHKRIRREIEGHVSALVADCVWMHDESVLVIELDEATLGRASGLDILGGGASLCHECLWITILFHVAPKLV